ncbi:hypothetical protein HPB50_015815 [Hyalomma asiaticum]|uniref:Uncharacterized protein n=1 Tax=Hyalomma asiaticum TaxID=266040 RepID=A0ACB7RU98_HYAAI|nr:hypothetical protein HPB50_015815 [Hyalomma asiaticum]
MQQLSGDKVDALDSLLLLEIFLQKLPPNVKMVLTASNVDDLSKLHELAVKIIAVASTCFAAIAWVPLPHQELQGMKNILRLVDSVAALHNASRTSPDYRHLEADLDLEGDPEPEAAAGAVPPLGRVESLVRDPGSAPGPGPAPNHVPAHGSVSGPVPVLTSEKLTQPAQARAPPPGQATGTPQGSSYPRQTTPTRTKAGESQTYPGPQGLVAATASIVVDRSRFREFTVADWLFRNIRSTMPSATDNLEEWCEGIRKDIATAPKRVQSDLNVEKMDSMLARQLEAKDALFRRCTEQRHNRRLR